MKKFKIKEHISLHTIICIWLLVTFVVVGIFCWGIGKLIHEKDYTEHEVLSCIQYVSINIDEDGDINEELCYAFTYREDSDQLLHVTEYSEDEYMTVHVGKTNKFIMYENGDTKLYLTREVLSEFFYTKITEFEYE